MRENRSEHSGKDLLTLHSERKKDVKLHQNTVPDALFSRVLSDPQETKGCYKCCTCTKPFDCRVKKVMLKDKAEDDSSREVSIALTVSLEYGKRS